MIFIKSSLLEIIKSSMRRLVSLLVLPFRQIIPRYIMVTPSIMLNQVVYDRKAKKYLHIRIRDSIDYDTLCQIYGSEDYGTVKLKRHEELLAKYTSIIKNGSTPLIVDCGGNIGLSSRYFTENYKNAKVVCIEPDDLNMKQAKINNSSDRVEFVAAAVGSANGFGNIIDPGLGNNAYRMEESSSGGVKIITINEVLNQHPCPAYEPFIVKIDIEGFESDLFSKNTEWIEKFPLLIIELHDWMLPGEANAANFLKAMAPLRTVCTTPAGA